MLTAEVGLYFVGYDAEVPEPFDPCSGCSSCSRSLVTNPSDFVTLILWTIVVTMTYRLLLPATPGEQIITSQLY